MFKGKRIILNNINTLFSIKDLENLSGIKAHTIRIWEKRYGLFQPNRTESNIRFYDINGLRKLLNVTLLYNGGYKISKIAALSPTELQKEIHNHFSKTGDKDHFISSLKIAMLNFDQSLFERTYQRLMSDYSFRAVFVEVFIPFLFNIGLEWQTSTITPAHEHFISNLIQQKLQVNIERVQQSPAENNDRTYVLFLPMHEIHELGLLFVHYELISRGYKSIYLGQSVPLDNLKGLQDLYDNVTFVSYFTVRPKEGEVSGYLTEFNDKILNRAGDQLWVLGRNTKQLDPKLSLPEVKVIEDVKSLIEMI